MVEIHDHLRPEMIRHKEEEKEGKQVIFNYHYTHWESNHHDRTQNL